MSEEVIPILRVTNAVTTAEWYSRLGFVELWRHRFEPDLPLFIELARGGATLFLSEHTGDATPDTLVYLRLDDVDSIAADFGLVPQEVPWGHEIELRDPDGNRLRIGTPPAEEY